MSVVEDILEKVKNGEMSVEEARQRLAERDLDPDALLEVREPEVGTVVEYKAASESMWAVGVIVILVALELMFDTLFIRGLLDAWDQQFMAFLLGMASLIMAIVLLFYIYAFLPKVLIVKHRTRKIVPSKEIDWWSFK